MAVPYTLSSVPAQTPYVQYVSGSGQTVFPYPFEITQDSDLVVMLGTVVQPTDGGYTLSGQGTNVGGNVTFTVGLTAGTIVTLYRNIQISRITQLSQNGTFFSSNFNNEFNRIYLIMQQLQQSLLPGGNQAYALMIPNSNSPAPTTLLTPAAYANKYLSFDSNGNPTPAALTSSGTLTQAIIAGLFQPQTTAETAAGVTPVNLQYQFGDVRRYGAVGDGVHDDTLAFQSAINCAIAARGSLLVPACNAGSVYKITSTLTANGPFQMLGAGPKAAVIEAVGFAGGSYLLDINCLAADTVEQIRIEGVQMLSDNNLPNLIRNLNASYVLIKNCYLRNAVHGITYGASTRSFGNFHEEVVLYNLSGNAVYMTGFAGGGDFGFLNCTFTAANGFVLDATSFTDGLVFNNCNFEACTASSIAILGGADGVSIQGGRTELAPNINMLFNPAVGSKIRGLSIAGVAFNAASAASVPITLGGTGGQVRGFAITGNRTFIESTFFVRLNGDGESGLICGNYFVAAGTTPVNGQRAGVVVFGNESSSGKSAESWGLAPWGVVKSTYVGSTTGFTIVLTPTVEYNILGNLVTLTVPFTTGTSNATSLIISGAPAAIIPSVDQDCIGKSSDNGAAGQAVLVRVKASTGNIEVYQSIAGGAFTNVGTKTTGLWTVTYPLT
jgi:hypothetical protein